MRSDFKAVSSSSFALLILSLEANVISSTLSLSAGIIFSLLKILYAFSSCSYSAFIASATFVLSASFADLYACPAFIRIDLSFETAISVKFSVSFSLLSICVALSSHFSPNGIDMRNL